MEGQNKGPRIPDEHEKAHVYRCEVGILIFGSLKTSKRFVDVPGNPAGCVKPDSS